MDVDAFAELVRKSSALFATMRGMWGMRIASAFRAHIAEFILGIRFARGAMRVECETSIFTKNRWQQAFNVGLHFAIAQLRRCGEGDTPSTSVLQAHH